MNPVRTAVVVGCIVTAACPFSAFAGRVAAAPTRSAAAPAAPRIGSFPIPRTGLPSFGRLTNSQVSNLNTQLRLDRLTSATARIYDIVPPKPPEAVPPGPLPGYQVVRLGRGHNNRLCFAATIAGTKGLMMLDTGASNTALSDGVYHTLLSNASYRLPAGVPRVASFNGMNTRLAEAPDFRVNKVNLGAVPICLISRGDLFDTGPSEGKGQPYDGLVGQNILRHYNAMIDCARLVLYVNLDPAKKLDLSTSLARNGWTRVPMSDTGSHFVVPCVLNGHRFRLVVDTGSPFTNLDRNLLAEAQVGTRDVPLRGGLIGKEAGQVSLVDSDRLQIGSYTATDVHMTATSQSLAAFAGRNDRSPDEPIVGLLGGDLLARHGAIIDMGNRVLYLKHVVNKAGKAR